MFFDKCFETRVADIMEMIFMVFEHDFVKVPNMYILTNMCHTNAEWNFTSLMEIYKIKFTF